MFIVINWLAQVKNLVLQDCSGTVYSKVCNSLPLRRRVVWCGMYSVLVAACQDTLM